jgi:hypothetical protein
VNFGVKATMATRSSSPDFSSGALVNQTVSWCLRLWVPRRELLVRKIHDV